MARQNRRMDCFVASAPRNDGHLPPNAQITCIAGSQLQSLLDRAKDSLHTAAALRNEFGNRHSLPMAPRRAQGTRLDPANGDAGLSASSAATADLLSSVERSLRGEDRP